MIYVEFTLSEGMEQFLSCHRHAFEFFGGVPAKVMIDNLKVGVLRTSPGRCGALQSALPGLRRPLRLQSRGLPGAQRPTKKGAWKMAWATSKRTSSTAWKSPPLSALNPAARQWLDTVANVRLHGETHCKPLERFAQEKPLLKPLPAMPYDCAVIRPTGANGCCRVVLDTNRYTVPHLYASQQAHPQNLSRPTAALSPRKTHRHPPALLRPPPGHPQSRPHPGTAGPTPPGARADLPAGLPEPGTAGRPLRAQAAGKAPQRPAPHPEDRRPEPNLRPGQSRPRPPATP